MSVLTDLTDNQWCIDRKALQVFVDHETRMEAIEAGSGDTGLKIVNNGTNWSAGDDVLMYASTVAPHKAVIKDGTSASPIEIVGPTLKASRKEALTIAAIEAAGGAGTDGADQVAALMGISEGLAASQTQTVGVYGGAKNASNEEGAGTNPDACGVYGTGGASAKATAIGGNFTARRDVSTCDLTGIQVAAHNRGETGTYATAGASSTIGVWIVATGTADSGAAINIGNPFSRKFKVGIGVPLQNGGPISEATLRDNGESEFGIDIVGTKSKAAIRVKSPGAGAILVGHAELGTANALLEVMNDEAGRDPIAVFGSITAAQKYTVMVRNSVGSNRMFIGGAAEDFFAGSAAGDSGVEFTAGKAFRIGAVGKTHKITVTEGGLSFYGVAPTTRAAAIAEPAETLASLKEKVNAIRTALKNIGITE